MKQGHGCALDSDQRSPPTRGAWIETPGGGMSAATAVSPPTRGAWIETKAAVAQMAQASVAPHAGGVD